jgi:hypothetical protein
MTQTEQQRSTIRKGKVKMCFKTSFKYVHIFGPPQVLWQAIPEAGGIITKGCLSLPLGPRFWDS